MVIYSLLLIVAHADPAHRPLRHARDLGRPAGPAEAPPAANAGRREPGRSSSHEASACSSGASGRSPSSTSRCAQASWSGSSARTAPARPPPSTPSPASIRPRAGDVVVAGERVNGLRPHQICVAGRRPHLPEHPALQGAHGARQRARRLPLARRDGGFTAAFLLHARAITPRRRGSRRGADGLPRGDGPRPPPGRAGAEPARTASSGGSRSRARSPRGRRSSASTSRRRA